MIKKFTINRMNDCIRLVKNSNKGKWKARYFPTLETDIETRINRRITSEDVEVLLRIDNDTVTGYLELLIDNDMSYLQILVFFSAYEFSNTFSSFYEYIKQTFPSYKVHYVVSDYSIDSIEFMTSIGAESDGHETMINISKSDYNMPQNLNVLEMNESHYQDFVVLHSSTYPAAYWTGDLLLEETSTFRKFVVINNEELVGYSIVSDFGKPEEEIYFVYGKTIEIKLNLVATSLNSAFERCESVQLLLDVNEVKELHFFKEIGFRKKEVIITFSFQL